MARYGSLRAVGESLARCGLGLWGSSGVSDATEERERKGKLWPRGPESAEAEGLVLQVRASGAERSGEERISRRRCRSSIGTTSEARRVARGPLALPADCERGRTMTTADGTATIERVQDRVGPPGERERRVRFSPPGEACWREERRSWWQGRDGARGRHGVASVRGDEEERNGAPPGALRSRSGAG